MTRQRHNPRECWCGIDHSIEADKVREELFDDPFVSNEDYGRLVEEAAEADERKSWAGEMDEMP